MSSLARDDGWILWGSDDREHLGCGVERIEEAARVDLWGGERPCGPGIYGGHHGRGVVGEGVGARGLLVIEVTVAAVP